MYVAVKDKLMTGSVVLVGGSWGSEMARRGMRPDKVFWTSPANISRPHLVRAITRDYALRGADVILANTFSTSPLLMASLGRLEDMRHWDHTAVSLSMEALMEAPPRKVALAGSFSIAGPLPFDSPLLPRLNEKELAALYAEKAATLAEAGCDLIYMERIGGLCRSQPAVEAAVATGLPVWVELALSRSGDGALHGSGPGGWRLADMAASLMSTGAEACILSHHDPQVLSEAIETIRAAWAGPIGVNLTSASTDRVQWQQEPLPPEDLATEAGHWRHQKVSIFCASRGAGPEHLGALRERFPDG